MTEQEFSTCHIEYIKKDFLDSIQTPIDILPEQVYLPQNPRYLKVQGIGKFWETKEGKVGPLRGFMEDLFSGLAESNIPLIFAIFGKKGKIDLFIGTCATELQSETVNLDAVRSSLSGSFRGIKIREHPAEDITQKIGELASCCCVTGQPGIKITQDMTEIEQIERLIRGLYGKDWGYIVMGYPLKNNEINYLTDSLLNVVRLIQDQEIAKTSIIAGVYLENVVQLYQKLSFGEKTGCWNATILLLAQDHETLTHVKTVARGVFGGIDSIPDRIRMKDLKKSFDSPLLLLSRTPEPPGLFRYPFSYSNLVNSQDLSFFAHLPTKEMPGFEVRPYARFNVSIKTTEGDVARIGDILDQDESMGISYAVSIKDLNKHGLVVGTTGSGKTNTIFYLLKELWKSKIPFLVIEPVKTEYRKLLLSQDIGPDLQVFTLGNNNVSPFRINPFEILPGVSVQSHIELLKAVFNASFYMWGPLPHVLEKCIHTVYTDKGWDLSSNTNPRGFHTGAQPTLTDLYNSVDTVVNQLGYSPESTMEIKGALKTRIDSMRLGGKGLMLDTQRTISIDALLNKPTVLELEPLGDDEEKCFIMGLILTRMYEYYISKGLGEKKGLGHITIIEEAHRLLGNYQADNPYVANVKGKAVEAFTNILAEIRAYGEGFLIADQIPKKLAPEIIKNTNLKVMHRIVAADDREVMGATMNLTEEESNRITSLNPGEAAVFSEGDWGAYHVKIPYSKIEGKVGSEKDDDLVIRAMETYRKNAGLLAPYNGCVKLCKAVCQYKSIGSDISQKRSYSSQMPFLMLSLIEDNTELATQLTQMYETCSEEGRFANDPLGVSTCAIIHLSDRYFSWLGNKYKWSFAEIDNLKDAFLDFYLNAFNAYLKDPSQFIAKSIDPKGINRVKNLYQKLCTGKQPTTFCSQICPENRCLYRYHIGEAVSNARFNKKFAAIIGDNGATMWQDLAYICRDVILEIVLPEGSAGTVGRLGLCCALQKIYNVKGWSRRDVQMVMNNLIAVNSGKTESPELDEYDVGRESDDQSQGEEPEVTKHD